MGKDRITDAAAKVRRTIRQAARKLVGDIETRPIGDPESAPAKVRHSRGRKRGTAKGKAKT